MFECLLFASTVVFLPLSTDEICLLIRDVSDVFRMTDVGPVQRDGVTAHDYDQGRAHASPDAA